MIPGIITKDGSVSFSLSEIDGNSQYSHCSRPAYVGVRTDDIGNQVPVGTYHQQP